MTPAIAVLVPVYNGARYLRACLDSLLAQSRPDFELIVRDDGSTDGSAAILAEYRDPRLRLLPGGPNRGLFGNLNAMLPAVRAPLVRVLCQDDALAPGCLEAEVAFFARHPEVGMAYCGVEAVDAAGRSLGAWPIADMPEVVPVALSMQLFFYHGCIVGNLSNGCVRREVLGALGPFDERYPVAGDYELWVRICRAYPLGVIRAPLVRVRRHAGQLSLARESGITVIGEARRVRAAILPLLPAPIRGYARLYEQARHNVLGAHHALRRLAAGDLAAAARVAREMGPANFAGGALLWLATGANRLIRPAPRFYPAGGG